MGHRSVLDKNLEEKGILTPPLDRTITRNNWYRTTPPPDTSDLVIYTDGSKMGELAGFGWAATVGDSVIHEEWAPIRDAEVFQAEVLAISSALLWLISNPHKLKPETVVVLSDSRAALGAL